MTSNPNTPRTRSAGPSFARLLAAVGFVLGSTGYTVQAFVASTSAPQGTPVTLAPAQDPELTPAPLECELRPLELTFATEGTYLLEVGALPLDCELAEG